MKRILSVAVLAFLVASPLLARQWTSRDGKHTIEAELIKVENGSAILKRSDGEQRTVPLTKLSEADVRYIEGQTKPAKAAAPKKARKTRKDGDQDVRWINGSIGILRFDRPVSFGPPGCPICVTDRGVWDIASEREQTLLESRRPGLLESLSAVSPDGRWYVSDNRAMGRLPEYAVWDTQTGKIVFSFSPPLVELPSLIHLTNDKLYAARMGRLEIRKVPSGEVEKTVKLPAEMLSDKNSSISLDGKYFATDVSNRITNESGLGVIDLSNGSVVVKLKDSRFRGEIEPSGKKKRPTPPIIDESNVSSVNCVAFSPDGQEIAAVRSRHVGAHFDETWALCWNSRGRPVLDEFIAKRSPTRIEWFPNGKAWLASGFVIDRESCRVVASIQQRYFDWSYAHVWNDNQLVGLFGNRPEGITVADIPWEAIQASLVELERDGAAYLTPERPIDVRVDLPKLGSRPVEEKTAGSLRSAVVDGFAQVGIRVEAGASTFVRVRATDQPDDAKPILLRQTPFDLRGGGILRFRTSPVGCGYFVEPMDYGKEGFGPSGISDGWVVVELMAEGVSKPVWRESIPIGALSPRGDAPEPVFQYRLNSAMERLEKALRTIEYPYFIPKADQLLALPVLLDYDDPHRK